MRNLVSRSALSTADNNPTQKRACRAKVPLFRVVVLESASSLAQQQLRSQYLVVGLPLHELLEVAQCCSHERIDLLCELLNGRAREFLGGRYELRDMLLGLFGVQLFFVEGLLAHRLVVVFTLMRRGIFCRVVGHVPPFLRTLGVLLFVLAGFFLASAMKRLPGWRRWAWPARGVAVLFLVLVVATGLGTAVDLGGLFERLLAATGATGIALLAAGVLQRS
jgi:hypothetical protein